MNKHAKIYIAGHLGMVGSAILRNLQQKGYNNFVFTPYPEYDLTNQAQTEAFFQKERPEYVIDAAAKVGGIVANNTYRAQFIYENLMIQNNIIHAAHKYGVKKLLFLGSSCIYPKMAPQPMKEEYLLTGPLEETNEPYAIAKITGIKMCESYYRQYGSNFISVMPTNLYGPNDNYDLEKSHVLPALIRKMHLGKCLENGDWDALRDDLTQRPLKEMIEREKEGENEREKEGENEGMKERENEGMKKGENEGTKEGENEGMKEGENEGMKERENEGMKERENEGMKKGENEGMKKGENERTKEGENERTKESQNNRTIEVQIDRENERQNERINEGKGIAWEFSEEEIIKMLAKYGIYADQSANKSNTDSNDSSNNLSIAPSFDPSFDPSSPRSLVPSFDRSFDPSSPRFIAPSFDRSFDPSSPRSFAQSFDRSIVPSTPPSFVQSFPHSVLLNLWGSGSPYREFLHVDDMADACVHIMQNVEAETLYDEMQQTHINIGTGVDLTIKELANMVKEIVGFKGQIEWDVTKPDGTPKKQLDVNLLHKLNWKHKISLVKGIKAVYDKYRD